MNAPASREQVARAIYEHPHQRERHPLTWDELHDAPGFAVKKSFLSQADAVLAVLAAQRTPPGEGSLATEQRDRYSAALTWIEENESDGIAIVARALSAKPDPAAPGKTDSMALALAWASSDGAVRPEVVVGDDNVPKGMLVHVDFASLAALLEKVLAMGRAEVYGIAFKHGRDYEALDTLTAMNAVDEYDALREAAIRAPLKGEVDV